MDRSIPSPTRTAPRTASGETSATVRRVPSDTRTTPIPSKETPANTSQSRVTGWAQMESDPKERPRSYRESPTMPGESPPPRRSATEDGASSRTSNPAARATGRTFSKNSCKSLSLTSMGRGTDLRARRPTHLRSTSTALNGPARLPQRIDWLAGWSNAVKAFGGRPSIEKTVSGDRPSDTQV
jgi:hypothetical protein